MKKQYTHHVDVADIKFTFAVELQSGQSCDHLPDLSITVEPLAADDQTFLIHFNGSLPDQEQLQFGNLSIRWDVPLIDVHGYYAGPPHPRDLAGVPHWPLKKQVSANSGFPFVSLFQRSSENRAAFGLIDQLTETTLEGVLSEINRCYEFHWHKSISGKQCNETLFVSISHGPWPDVLALYRETVDHQWHQPKMAVPADAYSPIFSSWTAIHHDVDQDWVLRTARTAAELGFGTWITDDGWFSDKSKFADYAYTGDWEPCPVKFPDFVEHVQAVQAMGMRYILWVAPFMLGHKSKVFDQLKHLIVHELKGLNVSNLSPQRTETAEFVSQLLSRLVNEYQVDGLKIDFLDSIETGADEPFYQLLSHAIDQLVEGKRNLLIEFRNNYTNLASRRYSNLYRASDVPMNIAMNRWQVTTLRLLAPDRAVHFDPALWHPNDTRENVAVHLINAIISVPVVSIEIDHYPSSHLDLIRYWINFYNDHRTTIIDGAFQPEFLLGRVPLIRFEGTHERIIGLYADLAFPLGKSDKITWILNGSGRPYIELLPDQFCGLHHVITRDKFGKIVDQATVDFPVARLPVEIGGNLEIQSMMA